MSKRQSKKKQQVKRDDFARVILTETVPNEIPLFFSNDGFYKHCKGIRESSYSDDIKDIFLLVVRPDKKEWKKPFSYKIRKDELSLRTLSLLHPSTQWEMMEFIKAYGAAISYYCNRSRASIRAPFKIGGSFFIRNVNENINKYKNDSVDTEKEDITAKHPASYFSYRGYNKIFYFFDSKEYLELERRYPTLWMIDVSKCFDSIYTHSICWAVKSKEFAKETSGHKTFGQQFDSLMQMGNHGETSGIVIGPEISRVFAEIILQDVDVKVIESLKREGLDFGDHFSFRRYVDDYFIFGIDDVVTEKVAGALADQLVKYKLHINDKKLEKHHRPFFTKKSRIKWAVEREINAFAGQFLDRDLKGDGAFAVPKKIHRADKVKSEFINSIKAICSGLNSDYGFVSGYIIGALRRRIIELIQSPDRNKTLKQDVALYKDAFFLILEVMFFFYCVEPSVTASYNVGRSIVYSTRFFSAHFKELLETIRQKIFDLSVEFLKTQIHRDQKKREGLISLEWVNVFLALRELGDAYLLPLNSVLEIFKFTDKEPTYFDLMSCLFYIRDEKKYEALRQQVMSHIDKKLRGKFLKITVDAELAHLFLDTLSCKFLDASFRQGLLALFYSDLGRPVLPQRRLAQKIKILESQDWFIKWNEPDLLNILEKKGLRSVY